MPATRNRAWPRFRHYRRSSTIYAAWAVALRPDNALRADLDRWAKEIAKAAPPTRAAAVRTLRHWQQDTDLAGVRDKAELPKLPDEERKEWVKLWGDVAAMLAKAGPKK